MANWTGDASDSSKLSQESTSSTGVTAFRSALNIFLAINATLGNALILIALHKVSSLFPPTKLFFRSLAVTDLCVGLIAQPLHVVTIISDITRMNWKILYYINKLNHTSSFILCGVSGFTSTAISVDRLLALLLGTRYRHVVTLKRVFGQIICFWLLGICAGLLNFWSARITLSAVFSSLILSLAISIFSYTTIFLILRRHQIQIQEHDQGQRQPIGAGIPLNIARYKKTVSSIAWVQLALVGCYLPFAIMIVFNLVTYTKESEMAWYFTVTLVYLNSSVNPFLFCYKIKDVRHAVRDTIKQWIG